MYPELDERAGTPWATRLLHFEHQQIREMIGRVADDHAHVLESGHISGDDPSIRCHLFGLEALLRAHVEEKSASCCHLDEAHGGPGVADGATSRAVVAPAQPIDPASAGGLLANWGFLAEPTRLTAPDLPGFWWRSGPSRPSATLTLSFVEFWVSEWPRAPRGDEQATRRRCPWRGGSRGASSGSWTA